MRLACPLLFVLTVGLAGCAEFPELDGTVTPAQANAPFPDLVPLTPLLAQAGASDSGAATAAADLAPRLAALRSRATRLRGPVIPAGVRARMMRGIR